MGAYKKLTTRDQIDHIGDLLLYLVIGDTDLKDCTKRFIRTFGNSVLDKKGKV